MKLLYTLLFAFFISCSTEPEEVKDCADIEGGSATIDNCGTCDSDSTNDCTQDCNEEWGGDAVEDCAGVCNGLALADNCGSCDSDLTNDCVQDCAGVWGGFSYEDDCGFCDVNAINDNTTCVQDCAGDWGGSLVFDDCEVCGGDNSSCSDCAGVPNGNSLVDMCGICNYNDYNDCVQDCAGDWGGEAVIDCLGECNGDAYVDECGVCNGDNSTCLGCDGVPNSGLIFDCADDCGGDAYVDECGVCDGNIMNDCLPEGHSFNESTVQAFYLFNSVTLDGVPIASDDWVLAYKGQVCVGARQWDTSNCGGGVCDVPAMGDDGSEYTQGYMNTGEVPSFSVYENSSGTYYPAFPSEPVDGWSNMQLQLTDLLEAFSQ